MPQQRRSKAPLILLIVAFSLCVICGVGGFFGWQFFRGFANEGLKFVACAANFEAVQRAILDYASANGGKLPKAASWQDDVRKYLKVDKDFEELKDSPFEWEAITPDGEWCCNVSGEQKTGICFNEELSGKKLSDIQNPMDTVLVFEIDKPLRNAHQKYVERPQESSPKIFGEHRDWFWAPVSGSVRGPEGKNFELKTRRSKSE